MKRLRGLVPWWLRICSKIMLSRLPVEYSTWKRLRLFEHGTMDQPEKALEIFVSLAKTAGVLQEMGNRIYLTSGLNRPGSSVLEIGPGDSLASALIAKSLGVGKSCLADAGNFITKDIGPYLKLAAYLGKFNLSVPWSTPPDSYDDIVRSCNATYLVEGLDSLKHIPGESVDYCFSNAVLEHIPKQEFSDFVEEFARILKPRAVSIHRVDLKDHLGGALNNLRFTDNVWESALFRNSGFYTNRIRFFEMVNLFNKARLDVEVAETLRWPRLPTPRRYLDHQFRKLSDEDLLVRGFVAVLKKRETDGN